MLHFQRLSIENSAPDASDVSSPAAAPRTLELVLRADRVPHETLTAALDALGFERFWEEEERLRAYIPTEAWSETRREQVEQRLRTLGVEGPLVFSPVAEKNWNATWEASLVPVTAGPFLIAPTWADASADHDPRFVLEIDPKMSFGTGHHESTRLALRLLAGTEVEGARVLDAGTGTAVLAIAAMRLRAASVLAFDTDAGVLENAAENITHNGVAGPIDLRAGTLAEAVPEADVPEGGFDLALANINRNALSEMLPTFRQMLAPGGRVVLAGLLRNDRTPMLSHAARSGFALDEEQAENEWWAARLRIDQEAGA